jgi:hypothetical protein
MPCRSNDGVIVFVFWWSDKGGNVSQDTLFVFRSMKKAVATSYLLKNALFECTISNHIISLPCSKACLSVVKLNYHYLLKLCFCTLLQNGASEWDSTLDVALFHDKLTLKSLTRLAMLWESGPQPRMEVVQILTMGCHLAPPPPTCTCHSDKHFGGPANPSSQNW